MPWELFRRFELRGCPAARRIHYQNPVVPLSRICGVLGPPLQSAKKIV